jgi:hypothetical protein
VARLDARARLTPQADLLRQLHLAEHARVEAVLDVVLVVRGRVGEVDGLRLEARVSRPRRELRGPRRFTLVLEQRLTHLARQVQPGILGRAALEHVHHPQHLRVVAKAAVPLHQPVQRELTPVSERRVPDVVCERERFAQGLVEPQRPPDAAGHLAHLEAVGEARAVVVALFIDEHLRLVHQPPKRRAVHDPVAVALVARTPQVLRLRVRSPARGVAECGGGRQLAALTGLLGLAIVRLCARHHAALENLVDLEPVTGAPRLLYRRAPPTGRV